ncbi:MAG: TonB-dependent receptor [Mediterranea sp.]|nr:TonB-dependent receptor [Mediterranea sp.]
MRYIFLSLLLIVSGIANAQVRGTVTDKGGVPIPGANVLWVNTTMGAITTGDGRFSIDKPAGVQQLIVSFMGYENDTIQVTDKDAVLNIILREGLELSEVQVVSRKLGTMKLRKSVMNEDMITSAELSRAACCNLGESFVTNPSVDVSYSDAATGAKQIRLLGLSGTYVQMLTENIPNYRGAAAPYGLGYAPGPWMQNIQVSKGTSSVKNGYEALAGQINVEFKKPQIADIVSANLFASSTGRFEANADASVQLSPRWTTMLLTHYENETKPHDANNDGFADIPKVEQYNVWNRWAYMGDHYVFQAGLKAMTEERNSGQVSHGGSGMATSDPYAIRMKTGRYEFFTKNAYIFNKEKITNMALILSGTLHDQDAVYGRKLYDVDQKNVYASLLFETELSPLHNLSTGLSFNYDGYGQRYRLTNNVSDPRVKSLSRESVTGAYAQYTFNASDKFILMAGLRGDYSNEHGFFVTPRAHIKYTPNEYVHFRMSAGKGYRTNHVLAENNYLLASSREVRIPKPLKQEEAWNYGASASTYIPIFGKTLNINAEYYYTDFQNQVVVDMDADPHAVSFLNLDGKSYSCAFQIEASYPFFEGFSLTAAYRHTDVKTTYNGELLEKPLTGKYKGLLTASYQTPLGLWQFDATLQMNGGGRMPKPYDVGNGSLSWNYRYGSFQQLSAQVTRYFRHWSVYIGGENLTNFKQENPIIGASHPWGGSFDSTMIWGPMHGAKYYIGLRYNLPRN